MIQCGIDLPMASVVHVGAMAGDEESYRVFGDLFDPIIEEYHGHRKDDVHVTDLDPSHLRVSCYLRHEYLIFGLFNELLNLGWKS